MATAASTLIQRSRRFLGDWPEIDALTASMASNATVVTVADGTIYSQGWLLQIDQEALYVSANGAGTSATVRRGVRGTTAASHASGATVLVRPHFIDLEYLDALNAAIGASFPLLYQKVIDETITTSATLYEYNVPTLTSLAAPIPYLSEVSFKETGDLTFRLMRDWIVKRGGTPIIHFRRYLPPGILRIEGYGPIARLTSVTDSLTSLFPSNSEDALTTFAAQYLLASGEARRAREDTGARDDRENANRPGSALAVSNTLYQRFQIQLRQSAMPPIPPHVVSVI